MTEQATQRSGTGLRRRWFSRRALLLHLEVLLVAPACAFAGWWQAERALGGNTLSWVYSIEWPVFALLALWGWWYLIHEDPEVYRARKHKVLDPLPGPLPVTAVADDGSEISVPIPPVSIDRATRRSGAVLAGLLGIDFALGMGAVIVVPIGRASGLEPATGRGMWLAHGLLGLVLAFGAALLVVRTRRASRIARLAGTIGLVGIAIGGAGGLLTASHPARLAGMGLMLVGVLVAGLGFLLPSFERLDD